MAGAGLLALTFAATPTLAADIPVRPPVTKAPPMAAPIFNWTGFYVGANAGYAWGRTRATDIVASNGLCWVVCGSEWGTDVDGFTGGLQAGWNYQVQNWVVGVEGDVGYLGVDGVAVNPFGAGGTTVVETRGGWFATLRGRAGVLVSPTTLAYVTGGGIYADTRTNVHTIAGAVVPISTSRADGFGWTAGAGFEMAADPTWSWKLEYLYYDLGSDRVGGVCCGGGVIQYFNVKQTGHIIRLGLNRRI